MQICGFYRYIFWFKIIKEKKKKKIAYVFVTGDVKVTAPILVEYYIKQILQWIIFTTEEQSNIIYYDSINSFSDIIMFTEKDISDLSTDFSGRNQANGKIDFGMHITKWIKALLHWVQDFYRVSGYTNIIEMNEVKFIEQLETALYRSYIRKKLLFQSNTKAEEASPGSLESEKNGKNGSQNSSIICPHLLKLMESSYITWCGEKIIHMQMETSPILLTRR